MTELRELGSSGLQTPALVLGGNVFGWTAKSETGFDVLDAFVDGGGTMVDTADVYSAWVDGHRGGESETMIGQWIKRRGRRDKVLIATKVGMLPGEGGEKLEPARIAAAADASLKRLGTDYIDLYYAHLDDSYTPLEETLGAFAKLVEQGKVRHLAASNFTAERLVEALEISAVNGWPAFEVFQPEYHLLARSSFEGPLQQLCIDRDIGVVPYFALAAGFLTGKYRSDADVSGPRARHVVNYANQRGWAVLAAMDEVSDETGASLAQVALAWNAAKPGVTAPIASATSVGQIKELMCAMELDLGEAQIAKLDAASMPAEAE